MAMNPTIDPLTTSFRQLKALVGRTDGQKLPPATLLRDSGLDVLFSHEHCDTTITVFLNGFYIYECMGRETVFAVDRIKSIIYEYQDNEIRRIPEKDFADGPCLIPLLAIGDGRIAHNHDSYDWYWYEFSLSDPETVWAKETAVPSAEEDVLSKENAAKVQEGLSKLTERQRQIVQLYYCEGMSQHQIAKLLNLRQSRVQVVISAARRKLQKFL